MRPLSRRALFALPVALPVAAVAAKVGVLGRVRSLWAGVLSPSAVRRVENLKPLPFTIEELWEPAGVKSPFRLVKTIPMPWRKDDAVDTMLDTLFRSSWGPAKFTDDELAATLGLDMKKSCGGRGVEASARENPAPHGHAPTVGAGHDQQTQAVAVRRDRAAPDVGNVAEPEAARESALRSPPPHDTLAQSVEA